MSAAADLSALAFPKAPQFPVGYLAFCREPNMNYQLNRCYSGLGEGSREDLLAVGARITNFADFKRELVALSDRTLAKGNKVYAAFYLRFAEFFIAPDDPEKMRIYDSFTAMLDEAYPVLARCRSLVPYQGKHLPLIHVKPDGAIKDVLVMHGGFDSFIEELFPYILAIREHGYEVYAFEGPGQGAALKRQHLPLTHAWEQPVAAVLDHCGLKDINLAGISLGGYLALRAAAYESRIKRVIAFDICYDFFDAAMNALSPAVRALARLAVHLHFKPVINAIVPMEMRKDPLVAWAIPHGLHVCGVETPFDFLRHIMKLSMRDCSHLVRQDVLLMAGKDDHLMPFEQFGLQMKALTNARSLASRVFTAAEHGGEHCQVGNVTLALNVIDSWLEGHRQYAPVL